MHNSLSLFVRNHEPYAFVPLSDITIRDLALNLSRTTHHLVAPPLSVNMKSVECGQQQLNCKNVKQHILKLARKKLIYK